MRYLIFATILPRFLCQYVADMGMKPDVTFGDQNDRFDLTSFVQQQNRQFDHHQYADYDVDTRRQGKISINGQLEDFSYKTDSFRLDTPAEHRRNVNKFFAKNTKRAKELVDRLHDNIKTVRSEGFPYKNRRSESQLSPDPEKEVLTHYAVPVELTIQGYMQAPEVE